MGGDPSGSDATRLAIIAHEVGVGLNSGGGGGCVRWLGSGP